MIRSCIKIERYKMMSVTEDIIHYGVRRERGVGGIKRLNLLHPPNYLPIDKWKDCSVV